VGRVFALEFPRGEAVFVEQSSALHETHFLQVSGRGFSLDFSPSGRDEISICGPRAELFAEGARGMNNSVRLPLGIGQYQAHVVRELLEAHQGRSHSLTSAPEAIENLEMIVEVERNTN